MLYLLLVVETTVKVVVAVCQVSKDWSMRRDGADIHSDVTVSLTQALLGGTIRVPGVHEDVVFTVRAAVEWFRERTE